VRAHQGCMGARRLRWSQIAEQARRCLPFDELQHCLMRKDDRKKSEQKIQKRGSHKWRNKEKRPKTRTEFGPGKGFIDGRTRCSRKESTQGPSTLVSRIMAEKGPASDTAAKRVYLLERPNRTLEIALTPRRDKPVRGRSRLSSWGAKSKKKKSWNRGRKNEEGIVLTAPISS